jgi:glycosyltransferase involved in cell wall biosynthesis
MEPYIRLQIRTKNKMEQKKEQIELSIIMPCLNEADTLEICIRKAISSIEKFSISAEIIIADNGSTDGSIEIAKRCDARVVHVVAKGYGNALMGGHRSSSRQVYYYGGCRRFLRFS